MLKVVVYDCGYGGEFFADQLESELPIMDIIRVIDWRKANQIQSSPKEARRIALSDLRPYIGHVDLIILANHLLTLTSLKFFRRKFKDQQFVGLRLSEPSSPPKQEIIVLTTKAVTRTLQYCNFALRFRHRVKTFALDAWPEKIDDGELSATEIRNTLGDLASQKNYSREILLGCSQFHDIRPELSKMFGVNIRIQDGFNDTIRETCQVLKIRGGKKKLK
ncbi:hypothetical protein IJG28_01470 [Candidatus Saccharibacteria bacterium]|nr:hypothetical protein [Candidatus Saccharibacteria bacterium]